MINININALSGFLIGLIQGFLAIPTLTFSSVLAKITVRKLALKKTLLFANILSLLYLILLSLGHIAIARFLQDKFPMPLVFGKWWGMGFFVGILFYILYFSFKVKR